MLADLARAERSGAPGVFGKHQPGRAGDIGRAAKGDGVGLLGGGAIVKSTRHTGTPAADLVGCREIGGATDAFSQPTRSLRRMDADSAANGVTASSAE